MTHVENPHDSDAFQRVSLSPHCAVDSLGDHVIKFEDGAITDHRVAEMRAGGGGMKRVTAIRYEVKGHPEQSTTEVEIIHAPDPTKLIQASLRFSHFMDAHDCLVPMITYGVLDESGELICASVHLPAGRYIFPKHGLVKPEEIDLHASNVGQSFEWLRAQKGPMLTAVQVTELGYLMRIPTLPVLDEYGRATGYYTVNAMMPQQGKSYDEAVYRIMSEHKSPKDLDKALRRMGFDVRLTFEQTQATAIQFLLNHPPSSTNGGEAGYGSEFAMG